MFGKKFIAAIAVLVIIIFVLMFMISRTGDYATKEVTATAQNRTLTEVDNSIVLDTNLCEPGWRTYTLADDRAIIFEVRGRKGENCLVNYAQKGADRFTDPKLSIRCSVPPLLEKIYIEKSVDGSALPQLTEFNQYCRK